jgi:hypothetical protein
MTRDDFVAILDREGWVGVDLDGTLAEWNDQTSPYYIGPPVTAMVDRVHKWIDAGRQVRIVTARVGANKGVDVDGQRKVIRTWLDTHLGRTYANQIEITNQKDLGMLALWDDLAVTVEVNSGRPLVPGFEEDDMGSKAKTSILCTNGTIFSVDLGEIYMVSISSDGALVENKKLEEGDRLISIFWKKSVRVNGKPTKCPVSSSEAMKFQQKWEGYEEGCRSC